MSLKIITFSIFLITLFLEALSEAMPQYFTKSVFTFLVIPAVLLHYYANTAKENYLYMSSFVFLLLGTYYYNLALGDLNPNGIIFYALGLLIYVIMVFITSEVYSIKNVFLYAIPFLLVFVASTYFLLKDTSDKIFFMTIIYAFLTGVFSYLSILNYITYKNQANTYLLAGGLLFTISAIMAGFSYYTKIYTLVRVVEVLMYSSSHFFMCLYMIEQSKIKISEH